MYGALVATVRQSLAPHPAAAQIAARTPAPTATYSNGLHFAGSVPIADRQWIVETIAHARPEAVRLIELVDGRTTVAPLRDYPALGLTWRLPSRRNRIRLALARLDGDMRSNRALVLMHELGHVVDNELMPSSLRDRLAAEVPYSGFCEQAGLGDCAPPEEKFADTFAKWAFRGALRYHLGAGYHLPVPRSLDAWGARMLRGR